MIITLCLDPEPNVTLSIGWGAMGHYYYDEQILLRIYVSLKSLFWFVKKSLRHLDWRVVRMWLFYELVQMFESRSVKMVLVYLQNGTDMKCYELRHRCFNRTGYKLIFLLQCIYFLDFSLFLISWKHSKMWFDMKPLSKYSSINFEISWTIQSTQYFEFRSAPNA